MNTALDPNVIAQQFATDGIVIMPGFFPLDQMRELAAELDAVVAADPDRPFGGGEEYARQRATRVRVWSGKDRPQVQRAMSDPRLAQITLAIVGPGYLLGGEGIFSTPNGCGQAWHQDTRSRLPDHYELNRIVFPSDVSPEQGALVFVPGSHRGPDLPPGGHLDPLPGQRSALPGAGTVVLMHTRCFHAVETNRSTKNRTQCNSRVRPATTPEGLGNTPLFRTGPWDFRAGKAV
jgi:hypothetical protein